MERPKINWNVRKITREQKKRMRMIARKEESIEPVIREVKKNLSKSQVLLGFV